MPSYSYIAVDAMGKEKKATIDAEIRTRQQPGLRKRTYFNIHKGSRIVRKGR